MQKAKQHHAERLLLERIAAIEAADVLVCKDIVKVKPENLKTMLNLVASSWKHFTLEIKLKLCRHDAAHRMDLVPEGGDPVHVVTSVFQVSAVDFSRAAKPDDLFNVESPTFSSLLTCFMWEAHDALKGANLLPDKDDDEEDSLVFDSSAAVGQTNTLAESLSKALEHNDQLKR